MQKHLSPEKKAPTSANQSGAEQEVIMTLGSLMRLAKASLNGKGDLSPADHRVISAEEPIARDLGKARDREKWLRKEILHSRALMLQMMRWGVMTEAAICTVLYYVRRDVASNLAVHGSLPANGTLPPTRWFVGTAFLVMVGLMFCAMTKYMAQRHVSYRKQLIVGSH